jgi:hypothetical protein
MLGLDTRRFEDLAELHAALREEDRTRVLPCAADACGHLVGVDPGFAITAAPSVGVSAGRLDPEHLWRAVGLYGELVASDERLAEVLALAGGRPCREQTDLLLVLNPVMALRLQPDPGVRTWAALSALVGQRVDGASCAARDRAALGLMDLIDPAATSTLAVQVWADPTTGDAPFDAVLGLLQHRYTEGIALPPAASAVVLEICESARDRRWVNLCNSSSYSLRKWPLMPWVLDLEGVPESAAKVQDLPEDPGSAPEWFRGLESTLSLPAGDENAWAGVEQVQREGRDGEACRLHLASRWKAHPGTETDLLRRDRLDLLCYEAVRGEPQLILDGLTHLRRAPVDPSSEDLFRYLVGHRYVGDPADIAQLLRGARRLPCADLRVLLANLTVGNVGGDWMRSPAGDEALALVGYASQDCVRVSSTVATVSWLADQAGREGGYALVQMASRDSLPPLARRVALFQIADALGFIQDHGSPPSLTSEDLAALRDWCGAHPDEIFDPGVCKLLNRP